MAEREIDEILAKMECALVFARVETVRGGVVRLSKAELELFAHVERARNFMMSVLQSEKADRKLLSQIFGGDCVRISRIRAVLESVQVLWPSSGEPRLRSCLNACVSVEQILGDLGLGFALRLAQVREENRMEAAAAATVERAVATRRRGQRRPAIALPKTEFGALREKEMEGSELATEAEAELTPKAVVPPFGGQWKHTMKLEQEDWADATTCSAPSTARFDYSSAPSTARCEDCGTETVECSTPSLTRLNDWTSEFGCSSPLGGRLREQEEQEEQERDEKKEGEKKEGQEERQEPRQEEPEEEEEEQEEQELGEEPQSPVHHGEGGQLQQVPAPEAVTNEQGRLLQEPNTVSLPQVVEAPLSTCNTQVPASSALRRSLLQPRPDEDKSAFEVSALEPWLCNFLERIFAFYASSGACLGLTKFRCFLRDAGLIASQAEAAAATTRQRSGLVSLEAAASLTLAQADLVYVQAKAGQGGMSCEAFLSAVSDIAWLCRRRGNPEDGIQRFCENLIAPLAPHMGSGEEELRFAQRLLVTAAVSAMMRRGNRGLQAVFGKYASYSTPTNGGRRGRWTMFSMKRFARDLDMMGEVSHNILQRLFDACVHFEVGDGRSSGNMSLSFAGFKLLLVMLAQRLRGMPEDNAVIRLCRLVLRLSVVKGADDLSEAARLVLGSGNSRVPSLQMRQVPKQRSRVPLRLGR